jgi:Lipoyl protein ligase A/B catalytic domain
VACRPSHAVAARTRSGLTASVPSTTSQPGTSSPPMPRPARGQFSRRADAVGASVRLHSRQAHPAGGQTTRRHSGGRGRPRWANHLVCPGQLVRYSIIAPAKALGIVDYVRRLEEALIAAMTRVGVAKAGRVDGRSGVSLPAKGGRPERKIAAIGVRVDGGVTLHGFRAQFTIPDLTAFERIVPCGIADAGVTSLSAELGRTLWSPRCLT